MIKLQTIIRQLDPTLCSEIEQGLKKTRADNFLYLFNAYRQNKNEEELISRDLKISSNSLYVLKSRLYDKIQDFISGDIHANKEEVQRLLNTIPEMCVVKPREFSMAFLEKLEKDLKFHHMHAELLVVYSSLKKINAYSDKYYYYSQLYNRHLAYSISLEKTEELLGDFNRELSNYHFSRSNKSLNTLLFLRNSIADHYELSHTKQIELIKRLVDVQLALRCEQESDRESTAKSLEYLEKGIAEFPESSHYKSWAPVLDALHFEYYFQLGQLKQAEVYFNKTNEILPTLLLYNSIAVTSYFLMSRIKYCQVQNEIQLLRMDENRALLSDTSDIHTTVLLGIHSAMGSYYDHNYKDALSALQLLLNENSFKEHFHINTEIRLFMVFLYILTKDHSLAESQLKNLQRKIKSDQLADYSHVLDLIKVFSSDLKIPGAKERAKRRDHFTLFSARNTKHLRLLDFLMFELEKRYN